MTAKSQTPPAGGTKPQERQLPKGVTDGDLRKFVSVHGQVFPIYVTKEDKTYCVLAKKPTLAILAAATSAAQLGEGQLDAFKYMEVVYNSCKLVADKEVAEDEELLNGAQNKVSVLFKTAQAVVGEAFV